jgi:hypothetical protein
MKDYFVPDFVSWGVDTENGPTNTTLVANRAFGEFGTATVLHRSEGMNGMVPLT